MHVPAATQWMRIAGNEVEKMCVDGRESMNAGDVWVHRGGGEGCDVRRLGFWMERLVELGDM